MPNTNKIFRAFVADDAPELMFPLGAGRTKPGYDMVDVRLVPRQSIPLRPATAVLFATMHQYPPRPANAVQYGAFLHGWFLHPVDGLLCVQDMLQDADGVQRPGEIKRIIKMSELFAIFWSEDILPLAADAAAQ